MAITKNKKLYDSHVVKLIVKKAVTIIIEREIEKDDVDEFIDDNFVDILKEAIK